MVFESRIICIGNQFIASDSAGIAVFRKLQQMVLPPAIELVEGGLAGLNLLCLLEDIKRIIFVDAVAGFGAEGSVVVLDQQEVMAGGGNDGYGHESGLPYLLNVAPRVCQKPPPETIKLVGIEGACTEQSARRAADVSLILAQGA